tara:strand:+ start:239 stop:688 length:450 start_codon:yes stop_codon:yes gene_type:complete
MKTSRNSNTICIEPRWAVDAKWEYFETLDKGRVYEITARAEIPSTVTGHFSTPMSAIRVFRVTKENNSWILTELETSNGFIVRGKTMKIGIPFNTRKEAEATMKAVLDLEKPLLPQKREEKARADAEEEALAEQERDVALGGNNERPTK